MYRVIIINLYATLILRSFRALLRVLLWLSHNTAVGNIWVTFEYNKHDVFTNIL